LTPDYFDKLKPIVTVSTKRAVPRTIPLRYKM
jgi:hypothetical protein